MKKSRPNLNDILSRPDTAKDFKALNPHLIDQVKAPQKAQTRAQEPNPRAFSPNPAQDSQNAPRTAKPARAKEPNKTEREYERILRARFPDATIRWEAYTLRLASRATYTPDYSVLHPDGSLEFHEVKGGYIFPKALVKLRIAAEFFPHTFTLAQRLKTGWSISILPSRNKSTS